MPHSQVEVVLETGPPWVLQICILMWAGNNVTRPFRIAGAAALAPFMDKVGCTYSLFGLAALASGQGMTCVLDPPLQPGRMGKAWPGRGPEGCGCSPGRSSEGSHNMPLAIGLPTRLRWDAL